MIYTSYFAKLSKLPKNAIPISICLSTPIWFSGKQYKSLAPNYSILSQWKEIHNEEVYTQRFTKEVINKLNLTKVLSDLQLLIPCEIREKMQTPIYNTDSEYDLVLFCYEKPSSFCHRHLIAEWLTSHDILCEEYEY